MSDFLLNLARRGAGLLGTSVGVSVPSVFLKGGPAAEGLQEVGVPSSNVSAGLPMVPLVQRSTTDSVRSPSVAHRQGLIASEVFQAANPTPALGTATENPAPEAQLLAGSMWENRFRDQLSHPPAAANTPLINQSMGEPESRAAVRVVMPASDHEPVTQQEVEHQSSQISAEPGLPQFLPTSPEALDSESISFQTETVSRPASIQIVSMQEEPAEPEIRPASTESSAPLEYPRAGKISQLAQPTEIPIHIRIGRIEVRGTPAPPPPSSRMTALSTPLGFARYARLRTYRIWPL